MVAREGGLNSHSVVEEAINAVVSPGEPSRSEGVDPKLCGQDAWATASTETLHIGEPREPRKRTIRDVLEILERSSPMLSKFHDRHYCEVLRSSDTTHNPLGRAQIMIFASTAARVEV